MPRLARAATGLLIGWAGTVTAPADASTIPAFARRYRASCRLCHSLIPALNAFGDTFAANGFRFAPGEPPRDTITTGDPLLQLSRDLPLAVRLDAYIQAYANGRTGSDLQTPYNLKILSGGPLAKQLSYYLYFYLFERGEVGGIEDAFLYVNDIGGLPLDLTVGQFQVSDPMFKRELRLEYQDYAIYRARVGLQPADLTYDRGVMAVADVAGFTLTGIVVNGNGRGEAGADRRLDNDIAKNFVAHVSRDLTPNLRLAALGYYGRQTRTAEETAPEVTNRIWMVGGDLTLSAGPVELNAQFLHREDDAPTFTLGEARAVTNGGFAELLVRRREGRWYGLALYNRVQTSRPLLNVRLGGPANVTRYETVTGGLGYLVQRNVRVHGEVTWDRAQRATVWTGGITTAF